MIRPQGQSERELDRLRALLIQPEADRLDAVEARVEALGAHVGDSLRLEAATAAILVEAFRRAEIARHRELAGAIAPVVVAAIRSEIKNSKDMMVEALYPLTGRLVAAAVANAFRELVDNLNERIDKTLSTRQWRLRLRAIMTGRSMSELALAEAQGPVVQRLLLLERGSGRLLAAWRADGEEDERSELASGLIAALTEFASSVYGEEGGDLRTLEIGGARIFLRASPVCLVAADCTGAVRAEHEREIDAAFMALVTRLDTDPDAAEPALAAMAQTLFHDAAPVKKAGSKWPLILLLACLIAVIAWLASGPILRKLHERRIDEAFATARAAQPEISAFPLRIAVDHNAQRVTLIGLAPTTAAVESLTTALAAPAKPYSVAQETALVAPLDAVEALQRKTDDLAQRLAALDGRNKAAFDVAASHAQAAQAGLRQSLASLEARIAALDQQAQILARDMAAEKLRPREKLAALLARTAIFFARDDALADPAIAPERVAAVADGLKGNDFMLRVIGHADPAGIARKNLVIAQKRAQTVAAMLIAQGVDANRLIISTRTTSQPTGLGAPATDLRDRRVTFEIAFDDEKRPQ